MAITEKNVRLRHVLETGDVVIQTRCGIYEDGVKKGECNAPTVMVVADTVETLRAEVKGKHPADCRVSDCDAVSQAMWRKFKDSDFIAQIIVERPLPAKTGTVTHVSYDCFVDDNNIINSRKITRVFKEGKEISKLFHRRAISPKSSKVRGDEDVVIKALRTLLHTPEEKAKYTAMIEAQEKE